MSISRGPTVLGEQGSKEGMIGNEERKVEQPTTQAAGVSEGQKTGINWGEVLGQSPGTVEQTPYAQAKEKAGAKEAEVSHEAIELAKDNFGELVYLLLKNPTLITQGDQLKDFIGQLSPELGNLLSRGTTSLPDAVIVIETIQREINNIFTDDPQLSEAEKKIREIKRQQMLIIGMAFLKYKMQVVQRAFTISVNEVEPKTSDDKNEQQEQQIQKAEQELKRPLTELVLDEEGNIIPQGPELSKEEYVEANYKNQPVSIFDRIRGKTEEAQRRKAAEEYERYKELLEKQKGKKPAERRLRIDIENHQNTSSDKEKFLLTELGLMDKDQLKKAEAVLPEIMTQIRATLSLSREILTATGVSGKQLFDALKDLSLSMIPSLENLTFESVEQRINEIIGQRRAENAQRIQRELEETIRQATISQLRAREKKLEEELRKKEEEEAKAKRESGKGTQPVQGQESSVEQQINDGIMTKLKEINGLSLLEGQDQDLDKLLARVDGLEFEIAGLEVELEERKDDLKRLEDLRTELGQLRRMAATQSITYGQEEKAQTQIINTDGIKEQIQEIEEEIRKLADGDDGLDSKRRQLARLKSKKARLDTVLNIEISINGQTRTIKEWLKELQRLKSEVTETSTEQSDVGEAPTKKQVEDELYGVRALIRYYSEDELSKREARILGMGDLQPDDVFTNEHLAAVESRNPELFELLNNIEVNDGDTLSTKKTVLFILSQAFGDKFIYPDDPNAPEIRGLVAILEGMGDLDGIASVGNFDEKMRELVNEYLSGKKKISSNTRQESAETENSQGSTPPETQPQENQKQKGQESEGQPQETPPAETPAQAPVEEQGEEKRRKNGKPVQPN